MISPYRVPNKTRLSRALLRPTFRSIFRLLSPIKITGKEHIPAHGAYVIAVNHVSLYEAPFVLAFWPQAAEAVGAIDIWDRPGQSLLVRMYGGIPVHRNAVDKNLAEAMVAVLCAGRPLLIAPEGGRSHTPGMQRAKPGLAYIVEKCQVPVLPVGVVGTTDDYLPRALRLERPALEMHIGQPVWLPAVEGRGEARRLARQRNADLIMQQVAALLPAEYRGFYA